MGHGRRLRTRGQGGFTMLEAVIVVAVASIGIISITLGLQTSVKVDNASNEQQRLNLALSTFSESVKRSSWSWWSCPSISDPPPNSQTLPVNPGDDDNHAQKILRRTLDEPEVAAWAARGVTYTITEVAYWNPAARDFSGGCSDPQYKYPAVRVRFSACWDRDQSDTAVCPPSGQELEGETIKRADITVVTTP